MTGVLYTVASGDLRHSANVTCWPAQARLEQQFAAAVEALGWSVERGHPVGEHGFIDSQRAGIEIFKRLPPEAPLVVIEAVWQYSHHVLPGLRTHRGPILLVANWSGEHPGLVGMLNLTASLTKAGVPHSVLWSEDFTDDRARAGLRTWLDTGELIHDTGHVRDFDPGDGPDVELGRRLAAELQREKAIIGVFDEGCMGMYNAIVDDELLNPLGIYKERLSQSALVAEMGRVADAEALAVRAWLNAAGMTFHTGADEATELTDAQLLSQFKMYIAALRIADDFGLDAVGIQYQQGLKDVVPASDLAEGLLNDRERPPVRSRDGSRELYAGVPLPHFNEVDEGAAVDALVTNRVWTAMGMDPTTTLHDVRWGAEYDGRFVWVFEISGAVPASHHGGYEKSWSMRQPPMYFPLGGGTLSGVSKPGAVVWSRVFIMGGVLHADIGRATALALPAEETQRRLDATTPQWPIMHAVLHGITRDQFMARHKANHLQVAYAPDDDAADRALHAKAAMLAALGVRVHLCGAVS
jgi:L-fucose isomerase-like protein